MLQREGSSNGPLRVSRGCVNFLQDVKEHLLMQTLNAGSQQNKTWQAGHNRRMLDAAEEKGPRMGPFRFLQGLPTS
jgi:hypothetical protein